MLKASLWYPSLPGSNKANSGYYINLAIAYYDNGQWISEGCNYLKINSSIVLLNQPLKQRYYYFYPVIHEGLLALEGIGFNKVHYSVSHKYEISSSSFWLGDGGFKKNNAKYSSGGFNRFFDNVFNGGKWAHGWYLVDVGNASDYTISFELHRHSYTHYHYPHH